MSYKITIERIGVEKYTRRDYLKVADYGNPKDKNSYSYKDDKEEKYGGPQYEYVTSEDTRTVTTEVFKQIVEDNNFNITRVISAINTLGDMK